MTARSTQTLDGAAIETARVLGSAVSACAVDAGLLRALEHYRSVADVGRRCGVHPSKLATLQAILDLMHQEGLLERGGGEPPLYRARQHAPNGFAHAHPGVDLRADVVEPWLPTNYGQAVWRSQHAFLGRDLSFLRSAGGWFSFDRDGLADWEANLKNPLYDFGRLFAVRALAGPGRTYLDLASGTGLGAQRLAEWSDWRCDITCVDKSADFVAVSRQVIYPPTTRVRHIVHDLNDGLPAMRARSFDGAMMIGALHYISNKAALLRDVYAVLRPGGVLAIGHCFVRSSKPDEAANDYTFSLVGQASHIDTLQGLRTTVVDAGFEPVDELHRGSQYSLLARKPMNGTDGSAPPWIAATP